MVATETGGEVAEILVVGLVYLVQGERVWVGECLEAR